MLADRILAAPALAAPRGHQPTAAVIDGSKNPELFPEWFVWELACQWLSSSNTNGRISLQQELEVSEAAVKPLVANVNAFQQIRMVLENQIRETRGALAAQGKSEDEITDATQALVLDYRYRLLELRRNLYEELSPASVSRLRAWIDRRIKGTKVHLRGRALEFFSLPR